MKKSYMNYKKYYEENDYNAFSNKTIELRFGIKQKIAPIINTI
jgi:hypothetical protein